MKARPHEVREALLAAVEVWGDMLVGASAEQRAWLNELARHLNQDPWREQLHLAIALPDWEAKRTALLKLAADPALERQPAAVWINLEWKLYEGGWVDDAIAVLRRAQFRYPDHVWVNHHLGMFTLGTEEAVRCQSIAVALRPQSAALRNHLGYAWAHLGEVDKALADYREAIRLKPSFSGPYVNISRIYKNQGRLEEAIDQCRQAIRINPNFHTARFELGEYLSRQGKVDEAEVEYREAYRIWPHVDSLYKFLLQHNRSDEVIAECRKDVQVAPQDGAAHYRLGWVLNRVDKLDEAVVELRQAARLAPRDAVSHFELGECLSRQGKVDEAEVEYREACRLRPDNVGFKVDLHKFLLQHNRGDEVIAECRKDVQLAPQDGPAHYRLGWFLNQLGRLDEAAVELREAARLAPRVAVHHFDLGFALRSQGKLDEATTAFREAIRVEPTYSVAHLNLVVALREHGRLDDAIAACREAIRLIPPNATLHLAAGSLLTEKGMFDEAFLLNRKAIRIFEDKFAENPSLLLKSLDRYNAACAALLTATGKGMEADKLEDAERARLKHQALVWLRDDLAARKKHAMSLKPEQLPQVVQILVPWQQDPDLASLRDDKQVQQLPAEDQELCRKLWADHAELVKSLQARLPAAGK